MALIIPSLSLFFNVSLPLSVCGSELRSPGDMLAMNYFIQSVVRLRLKEKVFIPLPNASLYLEQACHHGEGWEAMTWGQPHTCLDSKAWERSSNTSCFLTSTQLPELSVSESHKKLLHAGPTVKVGRVRGRGFQTLFDGPTSTLYKHWQCRGYSSFPFLSFPNDMV